VLTGLYLFFDSSEYHNTSFLGILCISSGIAFSILGVVISLLVEIEYNQQIQIYLMPEPEKKA